MVKEEIVEGLRAALNKGQSIKRAMMSFYNAGFNKQDIEEAAKALAAGINQQQKVGSGIQQATQTSQAQAQVQNQPQPAIARVQPPIQTTMPALISQPVQPARQFRQLPKASFRNVQMISDYTQKPRPVSVVITILLTTLLFFLMGVLATVLLFKDELVQFFSGRF